MAMNKKEQAAFEQLKEQSEMNRALRWSDYETEKDVKLPENGYSNGWSYNTYTGEVFKTWSGPVAHGNGHVIDGKRPLNASQRGILQFSTREKALKALRRALEVEFAKRLSVIDQVITATQEIEGAD